MPMIKPSRSGFFPSLEDTAGAVCAELAPKAGFAAAVSLNAAGVAGLKPTAKAPAEV
jgi:hypothetical protein